MGTASGVFLFAPEDSYLSFFNSPYIGHRRCSAVDIYPSHEKWHGPGFSPCEGVVKEIRKFKMGRKKSFPTEDYDYAIGIAPDGHDGFLVRMLHCEPAVDEGTYVQAGDYLGKLLRSRYFNYWTGPHYHVEVLHPKDFNRPSQSVPISVNLVTPKIQPSEISNQIECEVSKCTRNIVICGSQSQSYAISDKHYGHLASIGTLFGIIDAGIPHYKQGGILGAEIQKTDSQVQAFGASLGWAIPSDESLIQFSMRDDLIVILDGERIGGISTHIYSKRQLIHGRPPIFLLPRNQDQFEGRFVEGDSVVLSLNHSGGSG